VPFRVIGDVHGRSAGRAFRHRGAQRVALIADHNVKGTDSGVGSRLKCSENERLAENRLQQLGVMRRGSKPVPVSGRENDGVPYWDRRTWNHDDLESLDSPWTRTRHVPGFLSGSTMDELTSLAICKRSDRLSCRGDFPQLSDRDGFGEREGSASTAFGARPRCTRNAVPINDQIPIRAFRTIETVTPVAW
jgi:hypothetical protein